MPQDTIIVGAGPVGLLLAILLGRDGKHVTVVEKWPEVYDRPRAVTMDAEVARILASLGIDCDTDPDFENHKELYYWKNADLKNLQIVDWESEAPCGWHVTYWFNQPALERRLIALAQTYPTITLMRGWTAVALSQTDTETELVIENGTATQTLRAPFLVGADGANSFVREALELPVVDEGYFFDWLILDMIPPPDYRASPAQWQLCDPKRPTTIVPGGPGRRRWEFMVLPGEESEEIAKPEAAWALMEPWGLTPDNATLERSAVYRFQARWTAAWHKGRCMIAGDAAHLMPPFAGEGMCAGLRDAVALGWRLSAILNGTLPMDVLQSYETERLSHAKHYIQFSRDLGNIICISDPEQAAARDARMMAELEARDHVPITGDLVTLGPGIWCQDTATAGALSPQGRVRFEGKEGRFDQVVGQGWMILAIEREATDLLSETHARALAKLGGRVVSLGAQGFDVQTLDDSYRDWMQDADAQYAIIRPDFYVAATAATAQDLAACIETLLQRLGNP